MKQVRLPPDVLYALRRIEEQLVHGPTGTKFIFHQTLLDAINGIKEDNPVKTRVPSSLRRKPLPIQALRDALDVARPMNILELARADLLGSPRRHVIAIPTDRYADALKALGEGKFNFVHAEGVTLVVPRSKDGTPILPTF